MGLLSVALGNPVVALGGLAVAGIGITAGYGYLHHKIYDEGFDAGRAQVQQKWDQANAATIADANNKTIQLKNDTEAVRRKKDAEIASINSQLADALIKLRNRSNERFAGLPAIAASGVGCPAVENATGAQLSGPDAEFLSRYAAATATLQSSLSACYAELDSIRQRFSAPPVKE